MGAGKSSAARTVAAELGVDPLDSDRELEAELGEPIEAFFDREGEAGVPRARGGGRAAAARPRRAAGWWRWAAASLESGARARRAAPGTRSCTWRSSRTRRGGARPARAGRWRATAAASISCTPTAAALYESVAARRRCLRRARDVSRRALPALQALHAARPPGGRPAHGVGAAPHSGDYPVFFGRGALGAMPIRPTDGRTFAVTDENVAAHHRVQAEHTVAVAAGEDGQDARHRRAACCSGLARAGCAARATSLTAVGGGVVGDLARAVRGALPARDCAWCRCRPRWWPRWTRPTVARPGWTCPRARTTPAPTTSRRPWSAIPAALDTLPPAELAAGYAEVVKTALIAGGPPVGAGARGRCRSTSRRSSGCLREPSWPSWPRTSATRAAARCSTSGTPWATRSRPRPATSATATARRWASGCWWRCGCRAARRCATRSPGCWRRAGLPLAFDGASVDDVVAARRARQEAQRRHACRSCWSRRPGEVTPGHEVAPAALQEAVDEVHARMSGNADRGAARGEPRPARAPRPRALRHASRSTSWRRAVPAVADELDVEADVLADQPRGRVLRELHRARERTDGLILNPGAWTHYSYAIRDALELSAACRRSRCTSPRSTSREEWRRAVGDPRPVRGLGPGQGRRRATATRSDAAEGAWTRERHPDRRPRRPRRGDLCASASWTRCWSPTW